MAKRESPAGRLDQFAEDLGRILGTAQSKAEGWMGQRQQITKQLTQIRDSAADLLSRLASGGAAAAAAVRRGGRKARSGKVRGPGRPKGRKVSAAARKKMSLAAKKRWAERKAAEKKAEK